MLTETELAQVPGEFGVIRYALRDFVGNYQSMDYGDPCSGIWAQLYEEYRLDQVVAGSESEMQAIRALKRWVRSRWDYGWSHSKPRNGLEILREAARGEQFGCGYYARAFVDCATALGWPARLVNLRRADSQFPRGHTVGGVGHVVAEIWSNDYAKWLVVDANLNTHYERRGLPLSALEVRNAWLSGDGDSLEVVEEEPVFRLPTGRPVQVLQEMGLYRDNWDEESVRLLFEEYSRYRTLNYFAQFSVNGWQWVDDRALPAFVCHFGPMGLRASSHVPDLYWSVNIARMSATPYWNEDLAWIQVTLEHCMPWFDHYERSLDGGVWETVGGEFVWTMHEGVNRIDCRAVNVMGRHGPLSGMDVLYARSQLQHVRLS